MDGWLLGAYVSAAGFDVPLAGLESMTEIAAGEKQQGGAAAPSRLTSLAAAIGATKTRGPAPVDQWHPPYCGEIDLRIAADGTWFYAGTPIQRPAMVALFAGILRKDPERYVLVTPVECVGITVEDVPFIAVAMELGGDVLRFATNLGDEVEAGVDHPMRFSTGPDGGVKPYVHIRGGLWARLTRTLAIELLDRVQDRDGAVGIVSGTSFFPIEAAGLPIEAAGLPIEGAGLPIEGAGLPIEAA